MKSKHAFSALLVSLAISLFGVALATNSDGKTTTRRSVARAATNKFDPGCPLPFKGVRTPAIDDHCGIAGGSSDPAKQAESRAKNNFCTATKKPRSITFQELVNLQKKSAKIPKNLPDRAVVENLGEGRYVTYVAFVKKAHYSNLSKGELVNCKIPGQATNDIHIVLTKNPADDDCQSTAAEMSPHYRPAGWTPKNLLKASAGHPVRVRGHLFFDGSHSPCTANSQPNPKRASVWEIHPVYSLDVCTQTTLAACQKTTAKWTPLSQ